jgi:adhesin YadB/C
MSHLKSKLSCAIVFAILSSSAFADPTELGVGATADSDSIAIGSNASGFNFGYAIGGNASAVDESIAIGENSVSAGKSAAFGSNSMATDESITIGMGSNASLKSLALGNNSFADGSSVALGYGASSTGNKSISLGYNSSATGNRSVAIGDGALADEDMSVSFGTSTQRRRLTNIADGINSNDAATYGQLQASVAAMTTVTSGMSATIASYGTRIGSLETAFASLPAPAPVTGADTSYVNDGDANTLASAKASAATGDAQTLASANTHADKGDAKTLAEANADAVIGDKKTLQNANWYSSKGDAQTLAAANAYSDIGDARLNRKIDDLDSQLSGGIAAVAAQPSLPAMAPGQKALAFGTGHYNGHNAIGIVAGYNPGRNLTYGMGISAATEDSTPVFRTFVTKVW